MKELGFIFLLIISKLSLGCTCYGPSYFDLAEYDQSRHIIEVKFINEILLDSIFLKNKDTLAPPTTFEFGLSRRYKIEIIEQYKGEFITKDSIVDVRDDSSCSHQPKLGETYIVYFYGDYFDFEMCQTIIRKESDRYEEEKMILTFLKYKKGDLHQIQLGQLILKGQFKHKKRVGEWIIYFQDIDQKEISIKLLYRKGILISVTPSVTIDNLKQLEIPNIPFYDYEYFIGLLKIE